MKPIIRFIAASVLAFLSACASIPAEAPELSAQLGGRLSAMESAHRQLLADFFAEKKSKVDDFIQREWVPTFASELFKDKRISDVWDEVVKSGNPTDRVKFIVALGPKLQQAINAKRVELMQPLEQLEQAVASRLKGEYDGMRAINSTLTAFLHSASKVEENRKRYLEAAGISDSQLEDAIFQTDQAVSELLKGAQTAETRVKDAEQYKKRISDLVTKIRKKGT